MECVEHAGRGGHTVGAVGTSGPGTGSGRRERWSCGRVTATNGGHELLRAREGVLYVFPRFAVAKYLAGLVSSALWSEATKTPTKPQTITLSQYTHLRECMGDVHVTWTGAPDRIGEALTGVSTGAGPRPERAVLGFLEPKTLLKRKKKVMCESWSTLWGGTHGEAGTPRMRLCNSSFCRWRS